MTDQSPAIPLSALRPIVVEAIRAVMGCPDVRGRDGKYLTDEIESVARAALASLAQPPQALEAASEVERDAARYRFIRRNEPYVVDTGKVKLFCGGHNHGADLLEGFSTALDAAVDAAMAQTKEQE